MKKTQTLCFKSLRLVYVQNKGLTSAQYLKQDMIIDLPITENGVSYKSYRILKKLPSDLVGFFKYRLEYLGTYSVRTNSGPNWQ